MTYELQLAKRIDPDLLISCQGSGFDVLGDREGEEMELVGDGGSTDENGIIDKQSIVKESLES